LQARRPYKNKTARQARGFVGYSSYVAKLTLVSA